MSNVTFILEAYKRIHEQRFLFVAVLASLYPVIVIANILIIYVICAEGELHKPMYILICNLACINLYGGSGLTPFIIYNILSGTFQIQWLACLVQIFSINTYGGCEIINLTVMAYDRYISICSPLTYQKIMSPSKVILFVAFIWLLPFLRCVVTLLITANLKMCGFVIEKVYCDNYSLVKLACSGVSQVNIYSATVTFFSVMPPLVIIVYSYIKIIIICSTLTRTGQAKAMSTCVPHLIAIVNFFIGCSFELFQSRFDMTHLPYTIRVVLSLYFLILSPVLNPILYGVRTQKIKDAMKRKVWQTRRTFINNISNGDKVTLLF